MPCTETSEGTEPSGVRSGRVKSHGVLSTMLGRLESALGDGEPRGDFEQKRVTIPFKL